MKKQAAYLAFVLVATFGLLELSAYFIIKYTRVTPSLNVNDQHLFSPYRGHELNPGYRTAGFARGREEESSLLHSPDGFRTDELVPRDKGENTIRIIAMGASTLYGIGAGDPYPYHPALENDETITYLLERRLNEYLRQASSRTRVEVINAGVIAYQTFQHLLYLNERLLDYKPDLVVFLDGHNDFYIAKEDYNHWLSYGYSSRQMVHLVNEPTLFVSTYMTSKVVEGESNLA